MARQEGFEPSTAGLEIRCSIQLSYWRKSTITCTKIITYANKIFIYNINMRLCKKKNHCRLELRDRLLFKDKMISRDNTIFLPGITVKLFIMHFYEPHDIIRLCSMVLHISNIICYKGR